MATRPSMTWNAPTTMSMIPAKTIHPLQAELRPACPYGACEDLAVGVSVIAHSFCQGCCGPRVRLHLGQCAPVQFRGALLAGPRPGGMTPRRPKPTTDRLIRSR